MKYKILKADSASELEKLVQKQIDKDWTPIGGVAHDSGSTWVAPCFTQAMILEDKGQNLQ